MTGAVVAIVGLVGTLATAAVAFLIAWLKMRSEARAAIVAKETALREHELAIETIRAQSTVELEAARERMQIVDGPVTNAQAWAQVFEVSQRLTLSLQADLARLEQRINDQDDEHRTELLDRDARYNELAQLQNETAGSLRRLRSYVVIVTNLLNEHGIAFPAMPDEDVEPERRTPTVTAEVVIHPKERS